MVDPEKAAGKRALLLAEMPQEPTDWKLYREILESSEPHEEIQWPQNFDWAIIRNVPLSAFPEATPKQIQDVDDPEERREHRERYREIVKLLKKGHDVWPVIVASDSGAILDGWHRLAALHELKRKVVDVLYV